ncbi:MAG: transcription-repair coupling factor [Bacteroidales bacterium]|nr:transcription-repair coupling factor [Bacteroidales bacterium]
MRAEDLIGVYGQDSRTRLLLNHLEVLGDYRAHLGGLIGSSRAVIVAAAFQAMDFSHFIIATDREAAAYLFNDLENFFGEKELAFFKKKVLFFPSSFRREFDLSSTDNISVLMRTEVLKRTDSGNRKSIIVTYPEALAEMVVRKTFISKNTFRVKEGDLLSLDTLADYLIDHHFSRVDFVYEPGQFSIRGGIVDVFSYTNDLPYRIEFGPDAVASLRSFNPSDQLSVDRLSHVTLVPNIQDRRMSEKMEPLLAHLPEQSVLWMDEPEFIGQRIDQMFGVAAKETGVEEQDPLLDADSMFMKSDAFLSRIENFPLVEWGTRPSYENAERFHFSQEPQPDFHKNFELLIENLSDNSGRGITNLIFSDNPNQLKRIHAIFEDHHASYRMERKFSYDVVSISIHEGFVDPQAGVACYTDHQIFDRYHKFFLHERYSAKEAISIRELYDLKPGDWVTHIDHGVGRFDGLEKIVNNGREQEAIRLIYENDDLLYISIHSLHRISKYTGKEGTVPRLSRLGSNAWNRLKEKTKKRVKDIAKDLIHLYAKRKQTEGFGFTPDTYLQHELEASFMYEDTPDQVRATQEVKEDMEASHPMDRLICGDVGFGKTEIAVRAAFKAVADSKQVAILVPTTILALQHYKTFLSRLQEFPCKVEYINRFRSKKDQTAVLKGLTDGTVDILIGTHRIISKDVKFKDLGLLIIDEEQKFGVAAKERLKHLKVNVDTLTLTATPIPRTLQFSLMSARDLSILRTPPPNRYPIQTEVRIFDEELIGQAIRFEADRGGQVFFVHNKIQNIAEVADLIRRIAPDLRIAVGHGQMEGQSLEKVMTDFIEGQYDVLVSTTIIESGLDIPNVNTIIINEAHHYGLSDLHQLRGRVGRSNRKAFCYLLTPPLATLTDEARKRLRTLEEFSALGSGFNIAMRDLDIRGAGNLLGAEQSGFISEIGFEMYHKILDEAIRELKETEFRELFRMEREKEFIRECQIETDLSILITDDYVTSITERLSLYKELDSISSEEELVRFSNRLTDRFGPMPSQTIELIDAIRLRWRAKELGFEKIVLKNERFVGYFIPDPESPYFQSERFMQIIRYIQAHPQVCRMKEAREKLALTIFKVTAVGDALKILEEIRTFR